MASTSTSTNENKIIDQVVKSFEISDSSLLQIKSEILKEFELGLSDEDKATIKMLITYVRELSRGDESGSYLALDLGGTHFRVLLVNLENGKAKVTTAIHDIPADLLRTQNGQELFDYIALKLLEFVQKYKLKRRQISLGFTFSFPCKQYGLTQSVLVKWCKGFSVGGVVGTDVVKQLKDALKRQLAGLVEAYIDVVAVINDTTGTLVACANTNPNCRIGLIVGTGFNSCYIESLEKCDKWPANYTQPKQVIINCEWGAMGDNKDKRELDKFRNEFDFKVDEMCVNPRQQTYEKMVSGMYIGELLRLSMVKLYKEKVLFPKLTDQIVTTGSSASASNSNSNAVPANKKVVASTQPTVKHVSEKELLTAANQQQQLPVTPPGETSSASGNSSYSSVSNSSYRSSNSGSVVSIGSNGSGSGWGIRSLVTSIKSTLYSSSPSNDRSGAVGSTNLTHNNTNNKKSLSNNNVNHYKQQSSSTNNISGTTPNTTPTPTNTPTSTTGHRLYVKDALNGKHLSMLAKDELSGTFEQSIKIMQELQISSYTEKDLAIVIRLSSAIINRSANLVATGVSALLDRIKRPSTVIGYDGSVIKHHPYFIKKLTEKCQQLTPKEHKFEFMLSSDGSGIGAAVVAAALHKERRPLYVLKPGKLYEMHFIRTQQNSSSISLD